MEGTAFHFFNAQNITVTVENQGEFTETFNVTAYANTTVIDRLTNITLASGNSTIIIFIWNTTGFAKGNYTISAYATQVPYETDTKDNTYPDGWGSSHDCRRRERRQKGIWLRPDSSWHTSLGKLVIGSCYSHPPFS